MAEEITPTQAARRLVAFFNRNGYVRRIDAVRRKRMGQRYKKGAEIRLVAESDDELAEIRRLLILAGFNLAQPFVKANHWRQPIYGVEEVARFLSLVWWSGIQAAPSARR